MEEDFVVQLKSQSDFGYTVAFRDSGIVVLNGPWHAIEFTWSEGTGMDPKCSGIYLIPKDASDYDGNPNATTIRCFDDSGNYGMRDKNGKLWVYSVSHFAVSILQNRK